MLRALFVVALVACSSPSKPATAPHESQPVDTHAGGASTLGKDGEVCAYGARSGPRSGPPKQCGPGLQCCYPCGISGCDSVCQPQCLPVP